MPKSFWYERNEAGIRQLGLSSEIGDVCLAAAKAGQKYAAADDHRGTYVAEQTNVTAGMNNEERAGAQVYEEEEGIGGIRKTLVRSVPVIEAAAGDD